jgi:hypothetical protein
MKRDPASMSRRGLAMVMVATGSTIGVVLLLAHAPLWAFYLAPLAATPVLALWLRKLHPRVPDRRLEKMVVDTATETFTAHVDALPLQQLLVAVRNSHPEDPYFALSNQFSASRSNEFSTYVVNRPNEVELFRAQWLRLLGMNTATVDDSSGEPIVLGEPGMSPAVRVSHVAVDADPPAGGSDKWLLLPEPAIDSEPAVEDDLDQDLPRSAV